VNEMLSSLNVAPLYGQVVVQCQGATDLPVPETGQERVVATTQSLLIATRGDQDGDVLIEIHRGQDSNESGEQVFDGELSFSSPHLVFGSPLAGELASTELHRAGWVPIRVYVEPAKLPSRVVVVVSDW
jgi:hypothetical protein